jgi:hypothetical protein
LINVRAKRNPEGVVSHGQSHSMILRGAPNIVSTATRGGDDAIEINGFGWICSTRKMSLLKASNIT